MKLNSLSKEKAIRKPIKYIIQIITWYFENMIHRLINVGQIEIVTYVDKQWKPYFHYKKLKGKI